VGKPTEGSTMATDWRIPIWHPPDTASPAPSVGFVLSARRLEPRARTTARGSVASLAPEMGGILGRRWGARRMRDRLPPAGFSRLSLSARGLSPGHAPTADTRRARLTPVAPGTRKRQSPEQQLALEVVGLGEAEGFAGLGDGVEGAGDADQVVRCGRVQRVA